MGGKPKKKPSAAPRVEKMRQPDDADLAASLGRTKRQWDSILVRLAANHTGLVQEWKYFGDTYGWQLKVTKKKRAVLYMNPHRGRFTASLALRDSAIAALRKAGVPATFVRQIEQGKEAPEGRPARIEVLGEEQAELVLKLVAVKLDG
jgi:hypothetical protein